MPRKQLRSSPLQLFSPVRSSKAQLPTNYKVKYSIWRTQNPRAPRSTSTKPPCRARHPSFRTIWKCSTRRKNHRNQKRYLLHIQKWSSRAVRLLLLQSQQRSILIANRKKMIQRIGSQLPWRNSGVSKRVCSLSSRSYHKPVQRVASSQKTLISHNWRIRTNWVCLITS